jgi:hypothetical protein
VHLKHSSCGPTKHHQVEPQGRRLSSWCMGLRLSSRRKSPCPHVSRHMTKPHRTSSTVMTSISSMSKDGKQLSKTHGIVRRSGAITNGSRVTGSSRCATWCSSAYSPMKAQINSPPAGRVHSPPDYGGWNTIAISLEHRAPL